jgi:hypothetical protein
VRRYNLPQIVGDAGVRQAVETEALSQRVITAIVRDALDRLLPVPLAQVLVRAQAERDALEAEVANRRSFSCRRGRGNRGAGIVRRAIQPREAREPRLKDAEATLDKLPAWDRKAFGGYRSVDRR